MLKAKSGFGDRKARIANVRVISRLSFFLVPFVICGTFQITFYVNMAIIYYTGSTKYFPFILEAFLMAIYPLHGK
jgi:hypothetical protein